MWIAAASLLIMLGLGVPIAIVLGLSSMVYMLVTDNLSLLSSVPQRMFNGVENYGLLAIPLFMLVGELMNHGGVAIRLIQFLSQLLSRMKGGLAYANVLANVFLASILGSASAQSAVMSRIMVPAMEKEGYKREFSAAITASSALIGPLIPPSMIFIIYGVVASVSIGSLFLAGIIPGILLGLAFAVLIYFLSFRRTSQQIDTLSHISAKKLLLSFLSIIPALFIPIVIVWGIFSGVFTATESAAIGCMIAFILGKFVYRELEWRNLPSILISTAVNTAIVTFIISAANVFGWIMALEMIPQMISEAILSIAESPIVFLLMVNILFLMLGMFMDEMAAIIILIPILMPIVLTYGIDPIHFGVIIVLNTTIALITPPVGYVLFTTSSIAQVRYEKLVREIMPFLFVSLIVLGLITYFDVFTLWIPGLLN